MRRGVSKTRRQGVARQQVGTMSVNRRLGPASAVLDRVRKREETETGVGLLQGLLEWTTRDGGEQKTPRAQERIRS